jgi:predicted metal-dependent peptidase
MKTSGFRRPSTSFFNVFVRVDRLTPPHIHNQSLTGLQGEMFHNFLSYHLIFSFFKKKEKRNKKTKWRERAKSKEPDGDNSSARSSKRTRDR